MTIEQSADDSAVEPFLKSLPFEPTRAQRRVIEEIATDMAERRPMNRLLQGEVGSGKTVVAVAAASIDAVNAAQANVIHEIKERRGMDGFAAAGLAGAGSASAWPNSQRFKSRARCTASRAMRCSFQDQQ